MIKILLIECMYCENTKIISAKKWYDGVQVKCDCGRPRFKKISEGLLL